MRTFAQRLCYQDGNGTSSSSQQMFSELETDFRIITAILTSDRPYTPMHDLSWVRGCPDNPGSDSCPSDEESIVPPVTYAQIAEELVLDKILRRIFRADRDLAEDVEIFTNALFQTTEDGTRSLPYLAIIAFNEFISLRSRLHLRERIRNVRSRFRNRQPKDHRPEKVLYQAPIAGFCDILKEHLDFIEQYICYDAGPKETLRPFDMELQMRREALEDHWIMRRRWRFLGYEGSCYADLIPEPIFDELRPSDSERSGSESPIEELKWTRDPFVRPSIELYNFIFLVP